MNRVARKDFVSSFNYLQREAFANSCRKGFHDGTPLLTGTLAHDVGNLAERLNAEGNGSGAALLRNLLAARVHTDDGTRIALMHSELSEALEALRKNPDAPDDKIPEFTGEEAELADVVIRIMDHGGRKGLRIGAAIVAKMEYNATRERMHGGKRF